MAAQSRLQPVAELSRIIRENRISEYDSPNPTLGMRPENFTKGASRWVWTAQPAHAVNPFGTVSGGYLAAFIDEMFAAAIASLLDEGELAVTAEMKLSFLRALTPGRLAGDARVVRRTRSLALLEATVASDGSKPAAAASSTWAISRR